jgi:hypothetical protein
MTRTRESLTVPVIVAVIAAGVVYLYRPTPIKRIVAEGGAKVCCQKYPGPNYMFTDNPKNTEMKDQSLGAGLAVPSVVPGPRAVLSKLQSDFEREQLTSPGVNLVAHAVA